MISMTKPLPTHRPWSGGSSENWFPPLARRCWRWLSPLKLRIRLRALPPWAPVSRSPLLAWSPFCFEALRSTEPAAGAFGPAGASPPLAPAPPRISRFERTSAPRLVPRIDVTPPAEICRVPPEAVAGVAGAIAIALPRIDRTADDVTRRCLNKVLLLPRVEWPAVALSPTSLAQPQHEVNTL